MYPGMQIIAVFLKNYVLTSWSLNDICAYMAVWFGVATSVFTGLIAYECSTPENAQSHVGIWLKDVLVNRRTPQPPTRHVLVGSSAVAAGLVALGIMGIIPAHLMRSKGNYYDNEAVAVFFLIASCYAWVCSLRPAPVYGAVAGVLYAGMAATWGGYVFLVNLIGVHAALLAATRFSPSVYWSYTLFYSVGTVLAMQVPVVGWHPIRSLEQWGPLFVFLGYQVLYATEKLQKTKRWSRWQLWKFRAGLVAAMAVVLGLVLYTVIPTGLLDPISSRVRGMVIKHEKTGNPLVDSVAEHARANQAIYNEYLPSIMTAFKVGLGLVMFRLSNASSFLLVWGVVAYFFSHRMARLIILMAPIGSILAGIVFGRAFTWALRQWCNVEDPSVIEEAPRDPSWTSKMYNSTPGHLLRKAVAVAFLIYGVKHGNEFTQASWQKGDQMKYSMVVQTHVNHETDEMTFYDDYRETYFWIRDNTPKDSRVMAWWDYGYHISSMANRTTLADGNTWNHEHIALLGLALTTDVDQGWEISRHMADYILLWTGGGVDDLAKSGHMARIATSVYIDHCPNDPACAQFGLIDGKATPMLARSMLLALYTHDLKPEFKAPADKFEEVFRSHHGRCRVFKIKGVSQESKAWVADPANRVCDQEGSWVCRGQYPPALAPVLAKQRNFAQLEAFNRDPEANKYTQAYLKDLENMQQAQERVKESIPEDEVIVLGKTMSMSAIEKVYMKYQDTEESTLMWSIINSGDADELERRVRENPMMAFVRSSDGRGPLWWAHEKNDSRMIEFLISARLPTGDVDNEGMKPADLAQ